MEGNNDIQTETCDIGRFRNYSAIDRNYFLFKKRTKAGRRFCRATEDNISLPDAPKLHF
jgi:hypothetical protein